MPYNPRRKSRRGWHKSSGTSVASSNDFWVGGLESAAGIGNRAFCCAKTARSTELRLETHCTKNVALDITLGHLKHMKNSSIMIAKREAIMGDLFNRDHTSKEDRGEGSC